MAAKLVLQLDNLSDVGLEHTADQEEEKKGLDLFFNTQR